MIENSKIFHMPQGLDIDYRENIRKDKANRHWEWVKKHISGYEDVSAHWLWLGRVGKYGQPTIWTRDGRFRKIVVYATWAKFRGENDALLKCTCGQNLCVNPWHFLQYDRVRKPKRYFPRVVGEHKDWRR